MSRQKRPIKTTASFDASSMVTDATVRLQSPGDFLPHLHSELGEEIESKKRGRKTKARVEQEEEVKNRPPPVNSTYVPLPWRGRIGYACLNTYLRSTKPPIFCSRTCRIETILKQGKWPQGLKMVQDLGIQNARDLSKLILWNEKYDIKFLRISSEMFPFASHKEYGYDLSYAKEVLSEAGKLAMRFGHRLTTHPGQFTQLGSPRQEVIDASVRDLEYHCQLLGYLSLEGQADSDAVMILHLGGTFGDKVTTLNRFKHNYRTLLDERMKARLVLENDDVSWSVHDLLPVCEELNIPLVLDWHHHNIVHDASIREGSEDILLLMKRIKSTWERKNITQKQHYSEPCEGAITDRDRRKHSARVSLLPPCENDMDLMIEAKDKEQAVFELYKRYNIGKEGLFKEVIPHERSDENKPIPTSQKKTLNPAFESALVPEDEVGMGGDERRVYWPIGNEDWLRPAKRVRKRPLDEQEAEAQPNKETMRQVIAAKETSKRNTRKNGKRNGIIRETKSSSSEHVNRQRRTTRTHLELECYAELTDSSELSSAPDMDVEEVQSVRDKAT